MQQPDGKLLMTGNRNVSVRNSRGGTVAVVRTTEDGELDSSFGGGVRDIFLDFHSLEGGFVNTWTQSAALQDDGRIVINGMVGADGHSSGFVFRLTHDGTLDPTFGTGGIVFSGGGFLDAMASIAIQSDGRVVTAGSQDVHWSRRSQEMRLRRFMPDGGIDTSFGIGGTSSADFQDMVPSLSTRAMARQSDGKLIVVGDGTDLPEHRPSVAVARFVESRPDFAGLIGLLAGKTLVTANENAVRRVVRRTGGSSGAVSVAYKTIDGTARAGFDYVPTVGRLEWAAGDSSPKSIPLVLIDDGNDEQEHFSLELFDSNGGAILALQTADIWSGSIPKLGFAIDRATIGEDDGSITLRVSRSGSGRGSLSVDFETYPITAQAGSDFKSAFGTLRWADGDTTAKAIRIAIVNDGASEGDEWFGALLSNPTAGATVGINGNVTVTVIDDDTVSPPPPPSGGAGQLSFLDPGTLHSVTEGSGPIRVAVYRSNGSTGQVSMDYATIAESATPGLDFTPQAEMVTWGDGETGIRFIDVEIVDDGER
jgi:uncharacterized delta-60 repeat protein